MLVINIYYRGKNCSAKAFVEEMESSGIADMVRAEEGNLRYEYFFSAKDKETVLLIDGWRSEEALDFPHKSPMMTKIAELRKKYGLSMRVERYETP